MEYVAPVNGDPNDPTRPYQDGDPSLGQVGSIPSARFFNLLMNEGRNLVEGAGHSLDAEDDAQWLAAIMKLIQESAIAQPGDVKFTATSTPPDGWLRANGAAVGRMTYAKLFAAIGTTYGAGDGETTFNLPDLRGEFIRGWDDGRGIDAGRSFGSWQVDTFKSHKHDRYLYDHDSGSGNGQNEWASGMNTSRGNESIQLTGASGGAETRPRNVAMLACIKY